MSAPNVFKMLIPAFRNANAWGAAISAYRSGTGLTDRYTALANTCSWSCPRISKRACVNRLRQKTRGRSSKVRAATRQTCLLVLYP